MASTDDDVVMDGNEEDDTDMTQDPIPIEQNIEIYPIEQNIEIEIETENNSNIDTEQQTNDTDAQNKPENDMTDTDIDTTNGTNTVENTDNANAENTKSLTQKIEETISYIPQKLEDCSNHHFYIALLLITEVKNVDCKEKLDYLLLFNFLTTVKEFQSFDQFSFGSDMLKFPKTEFIKLFAEKTDFDTTKIAAIYDVISENNCADIRAAFQNNISKIDTKRVWSNIEKCAANLEELSAINGNANEGRMDEAKEEKSTKDESWKQFKVGDTIDCRDKWGKWYYSKIVRYKSETDRISEAEIKKMDKKLQKEITAKNELKGLFVHYIGWDQKYDDWIFVEKDAFCDCDESGEGNKCYDTDHRLSAGKTQSEYKKRKRKAASDKPEPIQYKIKDFDKLVRYIEKTYDAPKGSNRTGIGAKNYAEAQKHGPGGNLTKFIKWDKERKYERFHHSHYDWWMFPNDRDSWGQGKKYAMFRKDIKELLQVEGYEENYRLGARLVLRSWGWDMDKMCFIEDGTSAQRWTGYNVRLLKMLYSTIILRQWKVYESVYKFCIGVLEKGSQFRSEPMMYEYLGLEKPKYVRRWGW